MIKRLKELRLEKGYNQKYFAERLNITQQTYSDYETGRTNPTPETLKEIAKLLECSIDYLLGFADDFGSIAVVSEKKTLSKDEENLLKFYRVLSQSEQRQVCDYINFLISQNKK